ALAVTDYAPWSTSRLEFTFNPFYGLTLETGDIAFSEQVMRGCRQTAGRRCILSNHDLDADAPSTIIPIYASIRTLRPGITFQSFHVAPADPEGTVRKAVSFGAGSFEIWQEPNGFEAVPDATLQQWAAMFQPQ